MRTWFDLPWDFIPNDGASCPVRASTPYDRDEDEQLMLAWLRERHENVEQKIYLDQSLKLMRRILAEGTISDESRRRARHLILAIRAARRDGGAAT